MSEVKIPEGYKQTEVGVIPEDWEVSNIKDISLSPTQNGLFYEPKRKGTGVPLINVSDMYKSAPIDVSLLELFDATTNELNTFKVNAGDLFFTRSSIVPSGIAFCNIFESKHNNVVFDSHLIRVQPNGNIINSKYLYLNCISQHARIALISEAKTATMTTIDQAAINRCPVLLPSKQEQTAIATALSDVDNLIQSLEKLIAKKEAIKTGTMQQLLTGKTRLPEFATRDDGSAKGFKQTELGRIPEDWKVVKFNDLTNLITCGIAATPIYVPENLGVPFLSSTNVKNGKVQWKNFKYISHSLHDQLYKNNPPKKGDVLYSRVGTIGEAAVIEAEFEFSVYVSLTLIKPKKEKLNPYYLTQLLNSKPYKQKAKDEVYLGGGVGNLNVDVVRNYLIITPAYQEQTAIATILSDMDAEIQALQQRLEKTRDIKQGMMQQLLTGKVRLAH
tara:strand:- start:78 stop:1412 length:1335 start_codon:yes stop_codon:yes gene_type:complete